MDVDRMPANRRSTAHQSQMTQPVRVRRIPPSVQATVPFQPARRPAPVLSRPQSPSPKLPPRRFPARARRRSHLLLYSVLGLMALLVMSCGAVALSAAVIYGGGVLPGVSAGGIALGGQSETEAAAALQTGWQTVTLRDGSRSWAVSPTQLGITLDAAATAKAAYAQGRAAFASILPAVAGRVDVPPVVTVDLTLAENGLRELAAQVEQPAVNAGIRLVDGQPQPTAPVVGRALDVAATLAPLRTNAGLSLADGVLDLVMQPVQPAVMDASPMLEQAARLLGRPFDIRLFDPVTGDSVYWSLPPEQWSAWLTAAPAASSAAGLSLALDVPPLRAYLQAEADRVLDASRYLKVDEVVADAQAALAAGRTTAAARVYHHDRQHVVQAGETIISIAWDYGVPYPYVQQANGGIEGVSIGQSITVPSPDNFLLFPVDPDKRIVVSISRQRTWVYEGGALKWDWPASTGISSSPTWPGIYQIISHEPNAYAANWNLWMPNFMGVYQPIPGSDFTNGFHGFPTRGGSQLLWTNSLGTRVTYGCILLSNDNIRLLYDWAQEGVVVEIQP